MNYEEDQKEKEALIQRYDGYARGFFYGTEGWAFKLREWWGESASPTATKLLRFATPGLRGAVWGVIGVITGAFLLKLLGLG